ncbi:MAG: UMP kinase [Candidatus Thalassarchaeum sp.]|tara:strand:+ start:89 stop:787 length:699 start_codon:yes stop_codon:yes gene_type:complete
MAKVVAALGGSLLRPEVEQRHAWLESLTEVVRDRVAMDDKLGIVVGGGIAAREGIELARPIIDSEDRLDRIGIAATRLNATIVRESLADAGIPVSGSIPLSVNEAVSLLEERPVVVMGGTRPGHTTDAVAIRLAVASDADRCIIATNVAKVYDSDPRVNPNARSFDSLTHSQLQDIVGPAEHSKAGPSQVVDPIGADVAAVSGMRLCILDGRSVDTIRAAIEGEKFGGTVVG